MLENVAFSCASVTGWRHCTASLLFVHLIGGYHHRSRATSSPPCDKKCSNCTSLREADLSGNGRYTEDSREISHLLRNRGRQRVRCGRD